jgi:two-component sensor histidine kinase
MDINKYVTLYRSMLIFLTVLTVFYCSSCQQETKNQPVFGYAKDSVAYQNLIAWDTLAPEARLEKLKNYIDPFDHKPNDAKPPQYWIYKCFYEKSMGKRDSLHAYLLKIDSTQKDRDLYALRQYLSLSIKNRYDEISSGKLVEQIILERQKIEKSNSIFLYLMDDLLAMSFYNNHEDLKSLKYAKQYMDNHPWSTHNRLKQRYYDIRFMLSQRLENTRDMQNYLDSSRMLAISINDSLAFMRTVDYEAQMHSAMGRPDAAVKNFRIFFNYLNRTNQLEFYVFNNLARAFLDLNLPDSTIKYVRMSEAWKGWKKGSFTAKISLLDLLSEAYQKKGDFKNAYLAKTKQYNEYMKVTTEMQKEKIEEISTKYETRKKDQDIVTLKETNLLNNKLLVQQRWIFVILSLFLMMILLYTYKLYKQKLLKAKHDQLLIENKQYILEQKNRQNQLNPHFIYNAIANLQGLIGADKKQEANTYLVALTRLIRDILELNRHDFITLEQEVRSLKNYIILQQMRFHHIFDSIIDTGDLDMEDILIPPMLIQPFVENAIEHGLKNIDHKGLVKISFYANNDYLHVCITDNGMGLKENATHEKDKKSLSQVITKERLALLYTDVQHQASLKIYSNYRPSGDGYKVEISLPLKQVF